MASDMETRVRAMASRAEGLPEVRDSLLAIADALAAQAAEIERLKALFASCAEARDAAGYMGTVPDCIAALAARVAELEAALRQIEGWEPATQEITLAHQMADLARAVLHPKAPAPAGEGGGS